MNVEVLDGGRLLVNARFLPLLRKRGLDSFDRIMACDDGTIRRDFPGRRTSRIEWPGDNSTPSAVYLKRYFPAYLTAGRRLWRWLHGPGSGDEARQEWEAIRALHSLGVTTVEPVACGGDAANTKRATSSFVMTAEVVDGEEGHRFAVTLPPAARRRFLMRVAEMSRVLHAAGWVHKDLYLAHFLVRRAASEPEIILIDLQRATRPCCLRRRWVVKDLAALTYSSLKAGATRSDIAAAFREYRGGRRIASGDRRLARAILRRIGWLKTRTPKHDTDFEQLR